MAQFHVGPRASRAGLPLCGSGPDNVWQHFFRQDKRTPGACRSISKTGDAILCKNRSRDAARVSARAARTDARSSHVTSHNFKRLSCLTDRAACSGGTLILSEKNARNKMLPKFLTLNARNTILGPVENGHFRNFAGP